MNQVVYRNEKPNLLNMFFDNHSTRSHFGAPSRFDNTSTCSTPATNIFETKEDYKLDIAAPGLDKKDFNIEILDGTLKVSSTIDKSQEEEKITYRKREFAKCNFIRNFRIPDDVNLKNIEANYTQGVLMILLPKREEAQIENIRKIKVG